MRILGIDTSGSVAAVALYDSGEDLLLGQQLVFTKRTHSQVILPLAERMLSDAGWTLAEVDQIAVAAGPGSYTGLRIGIAACKAMCYARGMQCVGVSTLKALACQADTTGESCVCAIMKARQRLVYTGIYRFSAGGSVVTEVLPDAVLSYEELAAQLATLQQESDSGRILLTGDGAAEFLKEQPVAGCVLVPAGVRMQNGYGICRAACTEAAVAPEQLEARYLQLVKAEKDRMDQQQRL